MHSPVLANTVLEFLSVRTTGAYIDATLGSGGHAELILRRLAHEGRLLGIDRDNDAIARARSRLAAWKEQCTFVYGNFADMAEIAAERGMEQFDGVLLDLGVSSEQLEAPQRGFSFNRDGPLDMRMDTSQAVTAADLVNSLRETELEEIIRTMGEDYAARRIARAIVNERRTAPIESTVHLAEVVTKAKGGRRGRIHPATQTFQALRIAVNHELEELEQGLDAALHVLRGGGRVAVISFHSLEDRVVKNFFKNRAVSTPPKEDGSLERDRFMVSIMTRKPITASREEVETNPRSRTAKLRVAEKLSNPE